MRIGFTADQERLRKRLRDYFAHLMTDELRAEHGSSLDALFRKVYTS